MNDPLHPTPSPTAKGRGHDNLIPAAASRVSPKRDVGPGTDTYVHMKFVVWAMQKDIDHITVRAVRETMRVSTATAQRLRQMWLTLTATRFYHDSAPTIVTKLSQTYRIGQKAANDDIY